MGKRKNPDAWSRLPEDWHPTPELLAWAREKRPDLAPADIEDEVENFVEYWTNRKGAAGEKKDWNRAFQTWIRRARARFKPRYAHNPNSPDGGVVL